ncbi:Ig-like domain-containing protein [Anaeromyxobacter paludicola]|uniref:RapA2 cadherin-like domain-containing protein n=1 Tax=Anaeromyxobacter paludicola TaxID=2918171 RepID=A0ABM7XG22_9BACT|nr:Ig-like domain-containing protein [Anaeromyxobacter paludicola]BDG10827.1 hypothetical protein AMPC_39400 [Anaeromyxobacter paludicola]
MLRSLPRGVSRAALAGAAAMLVTGVSCERSGTRSSQATPLAATAKAAARLTVANVNGTAIALTARRMTTGLRDGTPAPMWGYCATGSCGTDWAPGPTIVAAAGDSLQITLTNELPVPTSFVILGQLGGGVGAPQMMDGPVHSGQAFTTFPGNAPAPAPFVPPAQGQRVRSFGAEVAAASTATLTWPSLRPGTYLYETGTLPSLQVPMGLYGVLVVTAGPGLAYPGAAYDADAALLFSELDPVQNAAVDAAAQARTDVNLRFDDPTCKPSCYPAAVNYAPTYFMINGASFDRTAPGKSAFSLASGAAYSSGNALLRLLNAGSRTHVPAVVGLPMSLLAEDGNPAPGLPKVQNEVLLTAGKTFDVLVKPAASADGKSFAPATYPVFDRQLSLSTANHPDGGMQGFLLVNQAGAVAAAGGLTIPGTPGNLPVAITPAANPDAFKVPYNTAISGNVTANDVGVSRVALVTGSGPSHGVLTLNADGSFQYAPAPGYSGTDGFTYFGNGVATLTAAVTLTVGAKGAAPTANADAYTSALLGRFTTPRPGVLANDVDPGGYALTAGGVTGSTCGTVSLAADGSFTATGSGASCSFSYVATNSQGTPSAPATVTVTFGAPGSVAGLPVTVADASTGAALGDYRWTMQEDLTFQHDTSATPALSTRTLATSFHRSHMTVVATGCVGPTSCGSGQSVLDPASGTRHVVTDAEALAKQATPDQAALDPTKRYYLSILPGDGSPPGHTMGGAQVRFVNGKWAALKVKLQATPLPTAQMSIYVYEDSSPTNGQDEPTESGLGGFNIILNDPAGRTGDVAGQQTYDAFNMPLSNALLGRPGCPDDQNRATNGTGTSATGNLVGVVYTCPNPPPGYTGDPAVYALAGHALIKNLTPARYDVIAHPGAAREGAGEVWWQTETLEGTQAQDAFVGVNEPVYFQEFGPPGPHVTIGFVNPAHVASYAAANGFQGTGVVTGKVTNQHMSRPSDVTLWDSGSYDLLASTTCQVVLNSQGGNGPAVAAAQCDPDGNFSLAGVPAGSYDLAVFDQWLDQIIQNVAVTVPPNTTTVALGNIPVLSWFTQYDQNIFMDANGNGRFDAGEQGISNVPLTVRYRNGAPSNATLTDSNGNGLLAELFPLFNWYVAEADTTRFKQTGVHIYVDGGGKPDASGPGAGLWTSTYAYAPDGTSERVEQPGALSYGLQGFISQRSRVEWGRAPYAVGENGGIQGTVVYSSTRPFDDMRFNVQTIWEPLVPRVTVNLYAKQTLADGSETLALVDTTRTTSWDDYVNLVQGANGQQYLLGSDGLLRVPATGAVAPAAAYPAGAQVNLQCPGQSPTDPFTQYTLGGTDRKRCYDGWHSWNQVQAAPYDGRYTFPSAAYVAAHPLTAAQKAAGQTLVSLPPGTYVVEAVTPPGYEVVKEEDKNILIGDTFVAPATQQFGALASIFILPDQATLGNANPNNPGTGDPGFQSDPTTNLGSFTVSNAATFPECVGSLHRVPDYLSLFPQAQQVAPFAGMDRPLCDRKKVVLNDQMQSSANFFVFTEVPVASNNTGIILDDATSEFNAFAPDFGEKASVPFVPVSIKDFTGNEIARTYSDQWGAYNMMTPSSWLVNPPTPSGYGPNMLVTCINDPGPIADPATGKMITDPSYNPAYSNFCYTNPYMPGQTTYLDTPVVPIAAFAAGYNPADCAYPDATPAVLRVDGSSGFGPWVPAAGGTLTILALGDQRVPNPAYAGPFATGGLASQATVTRHYGFGSARGQLRIGARDLTASVSAWSDGAITVRVPAGTPTGELSITTAAGKSTVDAVTVTVGGRAPTYVSAAAGQTIQDAIDLARPGDLILVDAGTYNELVIMWKPVRLQGVGAASVVINAAKYPTSKLDQWRPRINQLFNVDPITGNQLGPAQVDPLPTQEITGGVVLLEPTVLGSEEGAGVTVLAKNLPASDCGSAGTVGSESNFLCAPSRIDGLSVTGGDAGGGVYVNGWAHGLEIANDRIYGNAGAFNGGVRVGVPYLELEALPSDAAGRVLLHNQRIAGFGYDVGVRIHHNAITKNGTVEGPNGFGGAGGGVSICTGTDGYSLDHNFICGNYSASDGGGVGHLGFSQGGVIANNQILFNQSFQQTGATHGGGIFVGGEPPVAGTVSLGAGDLTIDANLIRGNLAEGGQGGGLRLQQVNGADVTAFPQPARWHRVTVTNNLIVDNIAAWAGGGISLADTVRAFVDNDTIAGNDSTGTAGVVLAGGVPLPAATTGTAGVGRPGPSGIVSEPTSPALLAQFATSGLRSSNAISQPELFNDVIWRNRSFFYSGDGRLCVGNSLADVRAGCTVLADQATSGQCPAGAKYWDLGVLGDAAAATPGTRRLAPSFAVLTSTAGYAGSGNTSGDPRLVTPYCNGARAAPELPSVIDPPNVKNLQVAATVDEGNNYVTLRFGPLYLASPVTGTAFGDYHLSGTASSAYNAGTANGSVPNHDYDGQPRPLAGAYDIGADEYQGAAPLVAAANRAAGVVR